MGQQLRRYDRRTRVGTPLDALEKQTLRCVDNLTIAGTEVAPDEYKITGLWTGGGFGFTYMTDGSNTSSTSPYKGPYIIWAVGSGYSEGSCSNANTGRAWLGYGNYGCSATKFFIR